MPYSLRQTAGRKRRAHVKQSEDGKATASPSTLQNVQSEDQEPSSLHEDPPAAASEVEQPDAPVDDCGPTRYVDEAAREPSPPGEITATVKAHSLDSESESDPSSPERKRICGSAEPVSLGHPAGASPSAPLSLFGPFRAPAEQAPPSAYVSLFGPFDLPTNPPTGRLRTLCPNSMAPRRRWVPSRVARSQSSLGLHPAAFPTSESSPADASSSVHVGIREQMEAIKNKDPELREAIKATVQRMYSTNAFIEDLDESQMKWYKQVLLRSMPYLEQSMNTEAPTLRSLWPSLRQEIIRSIHSEFTRDQYTGFFYATRMILGLSEQELHAIHEEDNRVWETDADIPEHLRKLKELNPDMPIDPDMPPEREIVRAIEFLRQNGLPGSLLGEWQRIPGAEHWVPRGRQEQEETDASSSRALGTVAPPMPTVYPRSMASVVGRLGAVAATPRNSAVRPPPRTTAFPPRPHRFIPPTPRSQITPTASTPAVAAPGPGPQAQNNNDLYDPPSPRPRPSQLPALAQVVQGSPMRDPHWHPAHLRYALDNATNTTNPFASPYAPPTPPTGTTTMGPRAAPGSTMGNGAGNAPQHRAHAFHNPHSIRRPGQNLEPRHGPRALSALRDRFLEEIAVYGPGAGMAPRAAAGTTAAAARTMAAFVPGAAVGTVAAVVAEEEEEGEEQGGDEDEDTDGGDGDGETEE